MEGSSPNGAARVLILAYHYPPSSASAALRPRRFAKYLPAMGFLPQVVAAGESAATTVGTVFLPEWERRGPGRWAARLIRYVEARILGYPVRLIWGLAAFRHLRRAGSDGAAIVHTLVPPYAANLVARWLQVRHGLTWVADFQDPVILPDDPGQERRPRGLQKWALLRLERFVVEHADAVVANTEAVRELLAERYPACRGKVCAIPNGFDPDNYLHAAPAPERETKVIAHYGDLYHFRHPGPLLQALGRLIQAGRVPADRARVELAGEDNLHWDGLPLADVKRLLASPWVSYTGSRLPRAEAERATATADYLLLLDVRGPHSRYYMPAKVYDYITVGRPVLCFTEHDSPIDRLFRISGTPSVVVYYDDPPETIDRKVLALFDLPSAPVPFSRCFAEEHGAEALTKRLAAVYHDAAGARSRRP